MFRRWGQVCDLVIMNKRNRMGHQFKFICVKDVENVLRLEKDLDNILIDIIKIHVNLPRYKKKTYVSGKRMHMEIYNIGTMLEGWGRAKGNKTKRGKIRIIEDNNQLMH